jgi:hypothetical protein
LLALLHRINTQLCLGPSLKVRRNDEKKGGRGKEKQGARLLKINFIT